VKTYDVRSARNGKEAIELAQSFNPELILMDIKMPVMDALEATKQLRAMPEFSDTPIIALTAVTGSEQIEYQLENGSGHLAKPYMSKKLFKVLEKHLRIKS